MWPELHGSSLLDMKHSRRKTAQTRSVQREVFMHGFTKIPFVCLHSKTSAACFRTGSGAGDKAGSSNGSRLETVLS